MYLLEKMMCHFFEKSPKFYKNYPQTSGFALCVARWKHGCEYNQTSVVTNVNGGAEDQ